MSRFTLFVPGRPVPQGSKTAFVSKSTGRPIVVDKDVRLPQWRMKITAAAIDAIHHADQPLDYPMLGPVGAKVTFIFERPHGHYGTGKNAAKVKDSAMKWPAVMPDIDKLLRAVFDAVTDAQVIRDDSQVVWCQTAKTYTDADFPAGNAVQGVYIEIGVMR